MSQKISSEQVKKIARLSRLELTDAEVESHTRQLGAILGYMDKLSELDTSQVPGKVHAIDIHNIFRSDVTRPSLDHEAVLREAPQHDDDFFIVPKVFDN